jgi:hypothetical protein
MAKKKNQFKTEAELAEAVVAWLCDMGWTVYKEVLIQKSGKIADIVAVKDSEVWIVESKLIYGSKVLEQSYYMKDYSDYISVAIPNAKENLVLDFFAKHQGIGVLEVHSNGGNTEFANYVFRKEMEVKNNNPRFKSQLLESLHEDQKLSIAGSKGGGYVTPYKLTIDRIKEYLTKNGPKSINDIVQNVPHHYSNNSSAKATLAKRFLTIEKDFELVEENDQKIVRLK